MHMNFVCKYLLCPHKGVHGPCDRLGPKVIEMLASKEILISYAFSFGCVGGMSADEIPGCEEAAATLLDYFLLGPLLLRVFM